jgi:hypothetical protein
MASTIGNVRKQSVQVTAIIPLLFFTQTAALSGLPVRGRGGSSRISSRIFSNSASGLY